MKTIALLFLATSAFAQTTYTTLSSQGDVLISDSTKYVGGVAPSTAGCGTAYNLVAASGTRIRITAGQSACVAAWTGDVSMESGTVIARGNLAFGSNSQLLATSTISHDDSTSPGSHYTIAWSGKLKINGTCDNSQGKAIPLLNINSISGTGGDIGSTAASGGQLTADANGDNSCVKVDGWGTNYVFKHNLTTAGDTFILKHAVLNNVPIFATSHQSDGTIEDVADVAITNQRDTGAGYNLIWCENFDCDALTSGKRSWRNIWMDAGTFEVRATAGVDPGFVATEIKVRGVNISQAPYTTRNSLTYPVFGEGHWRDNLFIQKVTTAADIKNWMFMPPGVFDRTLLIGQHAAGCPVSSDDNLVENAIPKDIWFRRWVVDRDCGWGVIFIAAQPAGAAPWKFKVTESTVTGSPANLIADVAATVGGCTQAGSNFCGTVIADNNTMPTTAPGASNQGILANHNANEGFPGMGESVQKNIVYRSSASAGAVVNFNETPPNGTYTTVGHNSIWNVTSGAYQDSGSAIYSSSPGTGDLGSGVNPGFVDTSRNYVKYCTLYGYVTIDTCFAAMAPGTAGYDPRMSAAGALNYISDGMRPTNATFATAGIATPENSGTYLGAMPPTTTAVPVVLFSDLDSGPVTHGENNHGVFVCIYGKNFGATRGTSTITVGGVAASNYAYWGTAGTSGPASDKACFQMGSTTPLGLQDIVLIEAGYRSNPVQFTVRSTGAIYCVDSVSGSDANNGKFTTDSPAGTGCKATLSTAYALLSAGDSLYVKTGTYQTGGTGVNAILYLNGSGTAVSPKAISGYPGSTHTIGFDQSDTYQNAIIGLGDVTSGGQACDYHTIANLQTLHGGAKADQTFVRTPGQPLRLDGCKNMRVVGNRMTNPFQSNQQAAMGGSSRYDLTNNIVYEHAYNKYLGNEVFNTGNSIPGHVISFSPEPYTVGAGANVLKIAVDGAGAQTFTLANCTSCTAATIAADINSHLTGATAYATSGTSHTLKIQSNANLGGLGTIDIQTVANTAATALGLQGGISPGGAEKQTHSVYFGTNSHDIEAGWNHVHDNNGCRGFQMHSSPVGDLTNSDPTGITMYNMLIHDNYIHDVACDGINFASVDPSLGPIEAYNNIIWNAGTGLNDTGNSGPGGLSGIYVAHLANKMFSTTNTGCTFSTTDGSTAVTGSAQCHFTTELRSGWSICYGGGGTDVCVQYSATIDTITDDTHLAMVHIPAPYNRNFFTFGGFPGCTSGETCPNIPLFYRKTGVGAAKIYNNTIYNAGVNHWNLFGQSNGALCRDGGAAKLLLQATDNIIYATGVEEFVAPNGCLAATSSVPDGYWYDRTSAHNIVHTSGTNSGVPFFMQSNITTDPLFVSTSTPDFTLQGTSPALNAGAATASARDAAGLVRPQGSAFTLGSFEGGAVLAGCSLGLSPAFGTYTVGQAISTVTATPSGCGSGPFTFSVSAGALPTGLSLNASTGAITGTTTTAGTYSPTISVTDGGSNTASVTPPSITVNAAPSVTSSGALPAGSQGAPYSQALSTSGGTGALTCAVVTGSLPAGLSFASGCTISGTPSGTGMSTFTAHATDLNSVTGSPSSSLTITINGIVSPNTRTGTFTGVGH